MKDRMPLLVPRRHLVVTMVRAGAAAALGVAAGGFAPPPHAAHHPRCRPGVGRGGPHPDPRPGIDASHIARPEVVRTHPGAVAAFDEARAIPEILDGIRCQCGCADEPGMRSLLSCYEGNDPMALICDICEGQARLAYRLHRKGRSLDQIRAAIDARYGG